MRITNEDIKKAISEGFKLGYEMAKAEYSPKTGHWIDEGQFAQWHSEHYYRCSECGGHIIELHTDNFCKRCGTDMRGGRE